MPAVPDPMFLRQALRDAMRASRVGADPQSAVDFYGSAAQQAWLHMSRILGPLGARVIAEHGARSASRCLPEVARIAVTDGGVDISLLASPGSGLDQERIGLCLEEFCVSVFQVLGELTGDVILKPLLEGLVSERVSEGEGVWMPGPDRVERARHDG